MSYNNRRRESSESESRSNRSQNGRYENHRPRGGSNRNSRNDNYYNNRSSGSGEFYYNNRSRGSGSGGYEDENRESRENRENKKRRNAIKAVAEAVQYFPEVVIERALEQNNFDVNKTISFLNEEKQQSWSNVVAPIPTTEKEVQFDQSRKSKKEHPNEPKKTKSQTTSQSQTSQSQTQTQTTQNNQNSIQTTQTSKSQSSQTPKNQTFQTPKNQTSQTHTQTQQQNNQTNNFQTTHEPTLKDFELFEKNLLEQQGNLTKQTKIVNSLLDEYNTLRVNLTSKIENLRSERKKFEDKKIKLQEEYNQVCISIKEVDDKLQTQEKELVFQLSNIMKKAEQTKLGFQNL